MFFIKREYFNKTLIIKGLYTAVLLSACIYLGYFEFENKLIHTLIALLAVYQLLTIPRASLFHTGFFVGIFWFYWVSYSFIYYDVVYLMPLVILGFALTYGVLFLLVAIFDMVLYRTIAFMLLGFIAPFGFNWFQPQIILTHTYFEPSRLVLLLLFIATWFLLFNRKFLYSLILLIGFVYSYQTNVSQNSLLPSGVDIGMPQLMVKQDEKWERKNLSTLIKNNFEFINEAIELQRDMIVLPETAFPLVLNQEKMLLSMLKKKSKEITIVTGALYKNEQQYNNSTYVFNNGEMSVAHKVVLVPFGERIPFPKLVRDFINKVFYDGAQDYEPALKPTDFTIGDEQFRNAICYEATSPTIYENLNGVPYIIATSNNAWFTPSIEPTLQKMLMQYYAKKYDVIIYHVVNGSRNAIIHP